MLEVAVGVLVRGDGAVLLGQRRPGKPYAGWWEFPGGKLEAGETVEQALARELREELGIDVLRSWPWIVREHVYPHAHVRLSFRRVVEWSGTPRSREGQALAWRPPSAIDLAPLLPATVPVIGWLRLPPRLGISCAMQVGDDSFLAALRRALAAGLRLVQLREPGIAPDRLDRLWREMRAMCRAAGALLVVNGVHSASYAAACDGVHLRSADLHACVSRPPFRIVGASCHDARDLARAGELGVDYAVLGPVKPTRTHPGAPTLGWTAFRNLAADTRVPVFALGGLDENDAEDALAAGAHGVGMMRGMWVEEEKGEGGRGKGKSLG
ncbi:MAG: Nudix family hydrolase [Burkholderiales bacterium]|jgi:8-oxo-dGTP diphosphatase|nr:MAG: Nudix family hydrolase [Burkholderiales bacterium]